MMHCITMPCESMLQAAPPCSPSHSRVAWTLRADHASGRARRRSKLRLGWPVRAAPAGAVTAGRRHGQSRVVQELRGERPAGEFRPDRAELGHRQQGGRAQRFQRLHELGIRGKNLYLLHVLRRRMEYPELERALREQCETVAAHVVLIEDKASCTQLIQELVAEGMHAVTRYQPQSDKIMRMHAQAAMIENGFVHLPKEAAWLAEYLHELTVSRRASTTTRSTQPPRCSTGSSARARSRRTGCGKCINKPRRAARSPRGPTRYQ